MTIVEDALQAEASTGCCLCRPCCPSPDLFWYHDGLHLQHIASDDVVPVARGIRSSIASMKKGQQ